MRRHRLAAADRFLCVVWDHRQTERQIRGCWAGGSPGRRAETCRNPQRWEAFGCAGAKPHRAGMPLARTGKESRLHPPWPRFLLPTGLGRLYVPRAECKPACPNLRDRNMEAIDDESSSPSEPLAGAKRSKFSPRPLEWAGKAWARSWNQRTYQIAAS